MFRQYIRTMLIYCLKCKKKKTKKKPESKNPRATITNKEKLMFSSKCAMSHVLKLKI